MKLGICDVEVMTILLLKIAIKIISGYRKNDETLLEVTLLGHPVHLT